MLMRRVNAQAVMVFAGFSSDRFLKVQSLQGHKAWTVQTKPQVFEHKSFASL